MTGPDQTKASLPGFAFDEIKVRNLPRAGFLSQPTKDQVEAAIISAVRSRGVFGWEPIAPITVDSLERDGRFFKNSGRQAAWNDADYVKIQLKRQTEGRRPDPVAAVSTGKGSSHFGLMAGVLVVIGVIWAATQLRPSGPQPQATPTTLTAFEPYWVKNTAKTGMWSGPVGQQGVVSFGETSAVGCVFLVAEAPQGSSRIYVLNPVSDNYFWIDASAISRTDPPAKGARPPADQNCATADVR